MEKFGRCGAIAKPNRLKTWIFIYSTWIAIISAEPPVLPPSNSYSLPFLDTEGDSPLLLPQFTPSQPTPQNKGKTFKITEVRKSGFG